MSKWLLLLLLLTTPCLAQNYTNDQIADAIYKAENSKRYPYGIMSIDTKGDEVYARKICLNTIRNNRKRYADYGYKDYDTYLEFLASRYCPVEAHPLNKYWLKNVRYFLQYDK